MNNTEKNFLNINELCNSTQVSHKVIVKIVEYGIIDQDDDEFESWRFNIEMIPTIHKALRLHRDLDLNWSGVALALNLLNDVENLRLENKRLNRRLSRYLGDV